MYTKFVQSADGTFVAETRDTQDRLVCPTCGDAIRYAHVLRSRVICGACLGDAMAAGR